MVMRTIATTALINSAIALIDTFQLLQLRFHKESSGKRFAKFCSPSTYSAPIIGECTCTPSSYPKQIVAWMGYTNCKSLYNTSVKRTFMHLTFNKMV